MELVSVIIPTYKRSKMLKRAIESCLNQTYSNVEIIVVDDNNPDNQERKNVENIMKLYKNNAQVKYIKMTQNSGAVRARNKGISISKGNYIAFLDDDDYFFDSKIEKQLKFMKDENLDASFTANETYDESRSKIVKQKKYDNFVHYDNPFKYHLVEMIVGTQTFMYKKEVLEELGGFLEVPAGQEYCLMFKTIQNGYKIGALNEILTRICIHSGERITTGKNKIEAEKYLYNIKKEHFNILDYRQIRNIKYIYKYNIYQKYKSSRSFKKNIWLIYIVFSHPIIIVKKIKR